MVGVFFFFNISTVIDQYLESNIYREAIQSKITIPNNLLEMKKQLNFVFLGRKASTVLVCISFQQETRLLFKKE